MHAPHTVILSGIPSLFYLFSVYLCNGQIHTGAAHCISPLRDAAGRVDGVIPAQKRLNFGVFQLASTCNMILTSTFSVYSVIFVVEEITAEFLRLNLFWGFK